MDHWTQITGRWLLITDYWLWLFMPSHVP